MSRTRRLLAGGEAPAQLATPEPEITRSVLPDPTAAAFFDVDNTMMQGASIYWFARGLAARKYLTAGDLLRYGWRQVRFRWAAENPDDINVTKQAALAFIEGWRVADMERLAEEIFDEFMAERIWSGSRALAQLHLNAGQRVWLVTAAPVELGRVIAQRLGLTGAIGTVAEVRDGYYTGHLDGDLMHGTAKVDAITTLAAVEGLDLARCSAYSDSINDLPMLSTVGHPVAVNPDAALRRQAELEGWEIRDFRTGQRAVKIGVPAALVAGAAVGAVAAALALRRRQRQAELQREAERRSRLADRLPRRHQARRHQAQRRREAPIRHPERRREPATGHRGRGDR